MLKNILIYLIVFLFILLIVFDSPITNSKNNSEENEEIEHFDNTIPSENNFEMDNTSIIMSSNTNLTKNECFNKVNRKDINGASYNLKNNECILYFFAKKGKPNLDLESIL